VAADVYPVKVEAFLDPPLSRWLWLVKWVLAIPHYLILACLWIAFFVLSIAAFFAILFTGRYPRAIFDFNVGVLRWTWRVQYYTYGALGTDRYPPFSLAERPDYPAHLDVQYPERLSRGLVLVKWWLLAIPQYIIVGLFAGGGTWAAWRVGGHDANWAGGGLIGILVLVSAVVLLFTGRYPQSLFDFILGLNRWVLRVAAYAGLMTDKYPPFRLDMGGSEPGGRLSVPPSDAGGGPAAAVGVAEPGSTGQPAGPGTPAGVPGQPPPGQPLAPGRPPGGAAGWTPARIIGVVTGSVLALVSLGFLTGGGALLWADQTQRQDGYLTSSATTYSTRGYALTSESIGLHTEGWNWASSVAGKVRIHVTAPGSSRPLFLGIAPTAAAARYLANVPYATVTSFGDNTGTTTSHLGTGRPATPPQAARIWSAQVSGTGTQTLTWTPRDGDWTVVAMNADAAPGLTARAGVGATLPALTWIAVGLLAAGVLLAVGGALLIVLPIRRAQAGSHREPLPVSAP
jgi:uncharacterized protein DUF4389